MSKGRTFANDLLKLIFNATPNIANLADNASSSPATNLYLGLHSADVTDTSTQDSNEISYTTYARATVARSSGGFTVTNDAVALTSTVSFAACTAGSATATHWSVGVGSSGATKVLYSGVLGSRMGPFTAATSDTITIPGHTFSVDDRIAFYATSGSSLPTGISEGTVYFVKTSGTDVVTVSTTQGGTVVDVTAVGDGIAYKVTPLAISAGVTPQLTTGTTIYEE